MITALKKFLGRIGFMWCENCGSRLIWDKDRFSKGYDAPVECPHCDYLDRFNVEEIINAKTS